MNLKSLKADYYEFSGKASDLARQLNFAAIAVIWIFKKEHKGNIQIPEELLLPLKLIVISLTFDFFQYLLATAIWGIYRRSREKKVARSTEFYPLSQMNWPMIYCFWMKIACALLAYFYLIQFLKDALAA